MQAILDYLKKTGEQLDSEIATATGLSLASVRQHVTVLQSRGDIMICRSIRFKDGKPSEGMLCTHFRLHPARRPRPQAQGFGAGQARHLRIKGGGDRPRLLIAPRNAGRCRLFLWAGYVRKPALPEPSEGRVESALRFSKPFQDQ